MIAYPHVIHASQAISKIFKLLDVNKDGDIEKKELRDAFVKYSALRQVCGPLGGRGKHGFVCFSPPEGRVWGPGPAPSN